MGKKGRLLTSYCRGIIAAMNRRPTPSGRPGANQGQQSGPPSWLKALLGVGMGLVVGLGCIIAFSIFKPQSPPMKKFNQARALVGKNNPGAVRKLMLEAIELSEKPDVKPYDKAWVTYGYAEWLYTRGEYKEALAPIDKAIKACQAGNFQEQVANLLTEKAVCLHRLGRGKDALPVIEQAVDVKKKLFGKNHMYTVISLSELGPIYLDAGQVDNAAKAFNETIDVMKAIGDKPAGAPDYYRTYAPMARLGLAKVSAYRDEMTDSETKFKNSIAEMDQKFGPASAYAEGAIREYVIVLQKTDHKDRSDYYNEKLDNPVDFNRPDWDSWEPDY